MKNTSPTRRDQIRTMLADLKMPGALEAADDILSQADGGTITATEAIEKLLTSQITLRNNRRLLAAMRSSRLPAVKTLEEFDFAFQLMSRRYERASTVLTSNKPFDEWGQVLGDEVMAAALIDRVLHHCHIVNIRGNSYRMRHHTELSNALQQRGDEPSQEAATT